MGKLIIPEDIDQSKENKDIKSSEVKKRRKNPVRKSRDKVDDEHEVTRMDPKGNCVENFSDEDDLSSDDEYFFCDDCNKGYKGACPTHGQVTLILDREADKDDPDRSKASLPHFFSLATSSIPNADLGVWTKIALPRGIVFGPYEGKVIHKRNLAQSEYAWKVDTSTASYIIDAKNPSESNWLRYVNCANQKERQNMVAFQFRGQVYYKTIKPVLPYSELLIWRGQKYAKDQDEEIPPEEPRKFQCEFCEALFSASSSLKRHLKSHPPRCPKGRFCCEQCPYSTNNSTHFQYHLRTHSGEKPFKCKQCNKAFTQKGDLKRHILIHTGERPHKCQVCNKAFTRNNNQHDHMRTHSKEKPFKCESCDKSFSQKSNLKNHLLIHAGEHPHKCPTCDKAFKTSSALCVHMQIHSKEKPFKCEHCNKTFSHPSNFKRHLLNHTGELPHKCEQCDKAFNHPRNLKEHLLIHTGERPHKCCECDKAFKTKSDLSSHMSTHSKEKPYCCDVCGKDFKRSKDMKRHKFIHAPQKPLKCTHCDYRCIEKRSLKNHLTQEHAKFECFKCHQGFLCEKDLNNHLKNVDCAATNRE